VRRRNLLHLWPVAHSRRNGAIIISAIGTSSQSCDREKSRVEKRMWGNYFDCTDRHGQSDRFMKTVRKIADHIGQEYKGGGITRTEVMTQTGVIIQEPTTSIGVSVTLDNGLTTSIILQDILGIKLYFHFLICVWLHLYFSTHDYLNTYNLFYGF
jgi:hypothetical protein